MTWISAVDEQHGLPHDLVGGVRVRCRAEVASGECGADQVGDPGELIDLARVSGGSSCARFMSIPPHITSRLGIMTAVRR